MYPSIVILEILGVSIENLKTKVWVTMNDVSQANLLIINVAMRVCLKNVDINTGIDTVLLLEQRMIIKVCIETI